MIAVETEKKFSVYVRTNKRVKWQYAEYGGRYKSFNDAVKAVKKHFPNTPCEYMVEDFDGNCWNGEL